MSDLYLILRNRLDAVAEWVFIDSNVLSQARGEKGLSYETMARELHVSSKTWERYEKAGRIPRALLRNVAAVLDLDIEEPQRRSVIIEPEEVRLEALAELREHLDQRLSELTLALAAIDRKLDLAVDPLQTRRLEALLDTVALRLEQV